MSRSAVRVRSSAPPIRLLQAKYTKFSKPSVRRRGFSDTTQQARLQGWRSPNNPLRHPCPGHILAGGLLGGNTTASSSADGDAAPHLRVYRIMSSRGTLPLQLTLPASARVGV